MQRSFNFVVCVSALLLSASGWLGCSQSETKNNSKKADAGDDSSFDHEAGTCPTTIPNEGDDCDTAIDCEFGDDLGLNCNTRASCRGEQWVLRKPETEGCPTAKKSNNSACPTKYADVKRGDPCDPAGSYCIYPDGRCYCYALDTSDDPDAGAAQAEWRCEDPEPSTCPKSRPKLGSPCDLTSTNGDVPSCNYNSCFLPGGAYLQCEEKTWHEGTPPCD